MGLPFRRGGKQDGRFNGGMPAEFKLSDHGSTQLKVARRGGAVFASFLRVEGGRLLVKLAG